MTSLLAIMFLSPVWFLLIIPIVALFVMVPFSSRTVGVLRILFVTLLILALANWVLYRNQDGGTTVVVTDRSLSMPSDASARQKEIVALLSKSARPDDKLAVVSFGQTSAVEVAPQTAKSVQFQEWTRSVGRDGSDLSQAIVTAKSLISADTHGRILLLTDGRYTGSDPVLESSNQATEIPIDYRLIERPQTADAWIEQMDVPDSVEPGQGYLITAWTNIPHDGDLNYKLFRGQTLIASGKKVCRASRNALIFRDKASFEHLNQSSVINYRLEISTNDSDPIKENNVAQTIVGVRQTKPILHLCSGGKSGLSQALSAGQLNVVSLDPSEITIDLETLGQYSAVILENVPASSVTSQGLEVLKSWVENSGGGLMITGGMNSFGLGGYFRSPIDPILPVSMELKREHRKLSLALVAVLDRSGSMTMEVGNGKTKMDLANMGVAQSLEILSGHDQLGVLAVDTSAHIVAPLQGVENRASLQAKIHKIQSEGGGIFVYNGLSAAAKMLTKADAKSKHIILFADAADSEEPGDYQKLLEKCVKAGITCSVIALGTESDCDAELLKDVAKRGQGNCYFTSKAEELPRLFTQDTFTFTRNSFLDEPVGIQFTPLLESVTGETFGSAPSVDGYNLTYLRPDSQQEAISCDEYKAPLIATRYAGLGRCACYTGQADGKYTGDFGAWDKYNALFTSLARWTAGVDSILPPELLVTQKVINGVCQIRLYMPEDEPESQSVRWSDVFLSHRPTVSVVRAVPGSGEIQQDTVREFQRLDGSTLGVDIPIIGEERILSTVIFEHDIFNSTTEQNSISNKNTSTRPLTLTLTPVCRMYSPEYNSVGKSDSQTGQTTLRRLALISGGQERSDIASIWKDIPPTQQLTPIFPALLIGAIVVFLLEILERRTAWISSTVVIIFQLSKRKKREKQSDKSNTEVDATQKEVNLQPRTVQPTESKTEPSSPAPSEQPQSGDITSALSKAKSRADRRNL